MSAIAYRRGRGLGDQDVPSAGADGDVIGKDSLPLAGRFRRRGDKQMDAVEEALPIFDWRNQTGPRTWLILGAVIVVAVVVLVVLYGGVGGSGTGGTGGY